jgi:spermidine synthase
MTRGLRRYLYLTAALTGGAVMIIEILGAKMLAPYFGTSHFVWTAQIAVTLVALACGYYVGGRWVDRRQRLGQIYAAILAAAVYLAGTTAACERLAYACLRFSLPAGSLLTSALLFFIPLALLATVGPFFIRMLTSSVDAVGGNAGQLTAVSTFGSFLGTVLIGYVLIPFFANSRIMYGVSLLLILVALAYFLVWGRRGANVKAAALVAVAGVILGLFGARSDRWTSSQAEELARRNSNFGLLQVVQVKQASMRLFLNDYLAQDIYDPLEHKSLATFTYMLHGLARMYAPRTDQVLCIGLGVGIAPMQFAREGARVEVVEINPAVVPLAKEFFDLEPDKLTIHYGDGRHFLNRTRNVYDAVLLDAFLGESSPSHLMTREAFAEMKRVLKPEGVLVINAIASTEFGRDFMTASLYRTLTNVFAGVRVHVGGGNVFLVASARPDLAPLHPPDFSQVHPQRYRSVRDAYDNLFPTDASHGQVLTDDYNPVEFYDAANREAVRRNLAMGMKAP